MWIDDQVIKDCHQKLAVYIWVPESLMVVLGRSNKAEREVYVDRCEVKGVPVLQRYGGGGTVLLHPDCLVVSVGAWVDSPYQNDTYFRLLNNSVIETIRLILPVDFSQRGFSDIVLGEKKLAGTSLFRSRQYLLYQASILIKTRIDEINYFLRHPSREPDYRRNRKHEEFLTSLDVIANETGYPGPSAEAWMEHFYRHFIEAVHRNIGGCLVEPISHHIPHLLNRASFQVLPGI